MHILYIEDDLVDQMMFKRLCKGVAQEMEISFQIIDSLESLKKLEDLEKYDLIFSDIFLPDGNINSILELLAGREIIILSGETSPEFLDTFVKHEYETVYNKPLSRENLLEVLKKNSSCETKEETTPPPEPGSYTAIKLSNLERLSKGDPQDMVELMDIALDLLPQRMQELADGFEQENWGQVHFSAHAAKGVSRLVGIPVYEALGELDRKARLEAPDPSELFTIYQDLLPIMKQAYEELTHLKSVVLG